MTKQKNEEIKNKINTHNAMIESLNAQLKEAKSLRPYGSTRSLWLQSMKAMTSPFANYNRNIQSYIADPELHNLEKEIIKLQDFCLKIQKKHLKFNNLKKVIKSEAKLLKLEQKVLANPAYISQRYGESMNINETFEEVSHIKGFFSELKDKFKIHIPLTTGVKEAEAIDLVQKLTAELAELSDSK